MHTHTLSGEGVNNKRHRGVQLACAWKHWRIGRGGEGAAPTLDLEAPVYSLEAPNNKFWDPNFIFFQKMPSLTLLSLSHSAHHFIFCFLMCILLHYIDSTHNLSCL